MKRGLNVLVFVFLAIILFSSIAFVSAGFFSNLFNKESITGEAIANDCNTNADCSTNYFCVNGICQYSCSCTSNADCTAGTVCKDCWCYQPIYLNCTDTDGGENIYTKGSISDKTGAVTVWTDSCVNKVYYGPGVGTDGYQYETADACLSAGPNCYMAEGLCDVNSLWSGVAGKQKIIACPYGCANGACFSANQTNTTAPYCTDSDGGENYYTKGYLTVNGQKVFEDYCQDYHINGIFNTTTELEEGICYNNAWEKRYYQCPYGCASGACQNQSENKTEKSAPTVNCTDSDHGNDVYTRGNVVSRAAGATLYTTNLDFCSGNNLTEYTCMNGAPHSEVYVCPYGCAAGACMPPKNATNTNQTNCTDSDGGLNYYVKGMNTGEYYGSTTPVLYGTEPNPTIAKVSPYSYSVYYDHCANPTQLNEGNCVNGKISSIGYNCPTGCVDGACLGVDLKINGKDNPGPVLYNSRLDVTWTSKPDVTKCYFSGNWIPFWGAQTNNDIWGKTNPVASSGSIALAAAFAYDAQLNQTTFMSNLTIGISCIDSSRQYEDTIYVQVYNSESQCTDTDGGINYNVKGNSTDSTETLIEGCVAGTQNVREFYCGEDGKIYSIDYTCPNGCSDGACIVANTPNITCEPLSTNTEGNDKMNILLIPDRVSAENLDSFKNSLTNHVNAFYNIEPFKSNRAIINFYFLRTTQPIFNTDYPSIDDTIYNNALELSSKCKYNISQFIIVTKEDNGGFSSSGGGLAITNINNPYVTIHEFGHSFAGLADIYNSNEPYNPTSSLILIINSPPAPNTDEAGCPKWCQSDTGLYDDACAKISDENTCEKYNRINTSYGWQCADTNNIAACCVWLNDNQTDPFFNSRCVRKADDVNIGINCLQGAGCYYGAVYPGKWRPTNYPTIMGGGDLSTPFDPVSLKALELKIKCCYPQTCANFPSECKEYSDKYPAFAACGICKNNIYSNSNQNSSTLNCTSGCTLNNRCYPFGFRKGAKYCSDNSAFVLESGNQASCENNFECKSNLCIDSQCVNQGLFQKFLNLFRVNRNRK